MQAAYGFVDAVRTVVPPSEKLYTWWSYRAQDWSASDRGRRLDHVWLSPELAPHLITASSRARRPRLGHAQRPCAGDGRARGLSRWPTALPPLALTMGEPAGIGGEIALAAWRRLAGRGPVFLALDDPGAAAADLAGAAPIREIADPAEAAEVFADALPVLPLGQRVAAEAGRPDPQHRRRGDRQHCPRGGAHPRRGHRRRRHQPDPQGHALRRRLRLSWAHRIPVRSRRRGTAGDDAGRAVRCGSCRSPCISRSPRCRAGWTRRRSSRRLGSSPRRCDATSASTGRAWPWRRSIRTPGEDGAMGDEEERIIAAGSARLRRRASTCVGPLPADTMFHARARSGLRCGPLHVPRPGAGAGEDPALRRGGQRHARAAVRAHLARPRHGARTSPARAGPGPTA